jgi:hypothetical protein
MESSLLSSPLEPEIEGEEVRRLIGEIAKRHRMVVAPDDPLFVVLTVFELFSKKHLDKCEAILRNKLEAASERDERRDAAAKTAAEQIITAAADYHAKVVRSSTADQADALERTLAQERARLILLIRAAQRVLLAAFAAAALMWSISTGLQLGNWLFPQPFPPVLHCPAFTAPRTASSLKAALPAGGHSPVSAQLSRQ